MTGLEREYIELNRQVCGLLSGQRCVTLTTDMWTSRAGDGYFSLTAHFITDEFLMYSNQLQCHHMPGTHNHAHISAGITSALTEWCVSLDDVVVFMEAMLRNLLRMILRNCTYLVQAIHLTCQHKRYL